MHLAPGTILEGKFEILSSIGEGGMGHVYKARQINLDRVVALKCLLIDESSDSDSFSRLEREAQALSQINHKNIVSVYGLQIMSRSPYIVMEYVDGEPLSSILSMKGKLSADLFGQIALSLCEALSCAHASGVVHRDIKPSNVLITKSGEIKLLDFGLAKLLPIYGRSVQELTEAGTAVGSILYMSPEQCTGSGCDERSDIYALGCLLYHCLSGQPPFGGEHSVVVMNCHMTMPPPRVPDNCGTLKFRTAIQAVLDRAMQKDRDDRYQNIEELSHDLKECFAGKTVRTNASFATTSTDSFGIPRRRPALLVVAALVVLICSGYFGWTVVQRDLKIREVTALQAQTDVREANYLRAVELASSGSRKLIAAELLDSWIRIIEQEEKLGLSTSVAYRRIEKLYPVAMFDVDDPSVREEVSWRVSQLPGLSIRCRARVMEILGMTIAGLVVNSSQSGDYKKSVALGQRFYDGLTAPGPEQENAWVQGEFISAWTNALAADGQRDRALDVALRWSQQCAKDFPNSLADIRSQWQLTNLTKHSKPEIARVAAERAMHSISNITRIPHGASLSMVEEQLFTGDELVRLGLLDPKTLLGATRSSCGDRGVAMIELSLDMPNADITMKRYLATLPVIKQGQVKCMVALCDWYHRQSRFDECDQWAKKLLEVVNAEGIDQGYAETVRQRAHVMQVQNKYRMGRNKVGIQMADDALKTPPRDEFKAELQRLRGLCHFAERHWKLARIDMDDSLKYYKRNPPPDCRILETEYILSRLNLQSGDIAEARRYYRLAKADVNAATPQDLKAQLLDYGMGLKKRK